MKAKPCTLYGNNRWGYCFTPIRCESIARARKIAREIFFLRIVVKDNKGSRTIRVRGNGN